MISEAERQSNIKQLDDMQAEICAIKANLTGIGKKVLHKPASDRSKITELINPSAKRPITYRATRRKREAPTIFQDVKSAVRLDVHLITEPDFPYPQKKLDSPNKIFDFARSISDLDIECLLLLHLNSALHLNCIQKMPGTIDRADMHKREIIKTSLLSASTNIIMVHNHPSGSLFFSDGDKAATRDLKFTASCMNIKVLDHVLITHDRYISMNDTGEI